MIGFSWERAFAEAKRDIEIRFGQYHTGEIDCMFNNNANCEKNISDYCPKKCLHYATGFSVASTIALWFFFVPAMKWYISPKMAEAKHKARESHGLPKKGGEETLKSRANQMQG